MNPFIYEICEYLETYGLNDNGGSRFVFDNASNNNLYIGELVRGVDGVYAKSVPSAEPDPYTAMQEMNIDFWSRRKNSLEAYEDMRIIYELFHRHLEFDTSNYKVRFSRVLSQPIDLDRDGEGGKLLRISVKFTMTYLIS